MRLNRVDGGRAASLRCRLAFQKKYYHKNLTHVMRLGVQSFWLLTVFDKCILERSTYLITSRLHVQR